MTSHIRASITGPLGILALDRPAKINALTRGMLQALTDTLLLWKDDPSVSMVVLRGEGKRGFCAGGDIKDFHRAVSNDAHGEFADLLSLEFDLDAMIAGYPKPVVTLAHGLCMGGGIGLASHAAIRIATPESSYAMPEARIGYTPDVGGTHLMALAPGFIGEYLALTASTFSGVDAVELGFADMLVDGEKFADVLDALPDFEGMDAADIAAGLEVLFGSFAASPLMAAQPWIDHAFGAPTLGEILERLDAMSHSAAAEAAEQMRANCPTSMECALQSIRAARAEEHLRSALDRELRLAKYLMHRGDLAEGIRAQVIDKDRNPAWVPASIGEVDVAAVAAVVAEPN
ncbi:enoyl-CoA hydratase/isomerase family protein [Paeniglutamicibacter sp. NPDC012692]|uniref:enoyl-CoA hydratase/isomerase family protein n=1 Tax=Paeniglutamicibacter sp. NPDC012692 TaxID=3364388 RepID=UPI003682A638